MRENLIKEVSLRYDTVNMYELINNFMESNEITLILRGFRIILPDLYGIKFDLTIREELFESLDEISYSYMTIWACRGFNMNFQKRCQDFSNPDLNDYAKEIASSILHYSPSIIFESLSDIFDPDQDLAHDRLFPKSNNLFFPSYISDANIKLLRNKMKDAARKVADICLELI